MPILLVTCLLSLCQCFRNSCTCVQKWIPPYSRFNSVLIQGLKSQGGIFIRNCSGTFYLPHLLLLFFFNTINFFNTIDFFCPSLLSLTNPIYFLCRYGYLFPSTFLGLAYAPIINVETSFSDLAVVNFALPFTTNVTISISILQTFRFWVATFQFRPLMASLSLKSSDTTGLAPLMNVLFWGQCDFPISFSGRDRSRNVWNHIKGSSMVGTGFLPHNMRSPSPEYTRHSGWWPYTVTPSIDRTLHQFLTVTDLDLITEFDFLPNCVRFP